MTELEQLKSKNYAHYKDDPYTAGELVSIIGLLVGNEPQLNRAHARLLEEYARKMEVMLPCQSVECLKELQQIFKQIVEESAREQIRQRRFAQQGERITL